MTTDIPDIELRIEELLAAIDRSRKLTLVGKLSFAVGLALFLGWALNILSSNPLAMVMGIAFAIGGLVVGGSSKRSTDELIQSLRDAERLRQAAIDNLSLVTLPPSWDARPDGLNASARMH